MEAISKTLYHFLDRAHRDEPLCQLKVFKSIIEKGLKFSKIEVDHLGVKFDNLGICFTDIPLSMSEIHSETYGRFAIGFKQEFVKNMGGNPVFYFDEWDTVRSENYPYLRGALSDNLKIVAQLALNLTEIESGKISVDENLKDFAKYANPLRQVFSNFKEIGDLGPASDNSERQDAYYKEREWRILSWNLHEELNHITKISDGIFLKVNLSDIRIIIVPNIDIQNAVYSYLLSRKTSEDMLPSIITYDNYVKL